MSTPHVLDELSAYIDGESHDPQRIARHLQSCPECARRHMELSKLAGHVHALRAPEVLPGFSERIAARVQADTPTPFWRQPFVTQRVVPTAWALAAVLCIVGTAYVVIQQVEAPLRDVPIATSPAEAIDPDPELLAHILERGIWETPFEEADSEEDTMPADLSVDLLIDALAATVGEEGAEAWYEEEDLLAILETLAEADVQILSELAQDHWDEG